MIPRERLYASYKEITDRGFERDSRSFQSDSMGCKEIPGVFNIFKRFSKKLQGLSKSTKVSQRVQDFERDSRDPTQIPRVTGIP